MVIIFRCVSGGGKTTMLEYLAGNMLLHQSKFMGSAVNNYLGMLAAKIQLLAQPVQSCSEDTFHMRDGVYDFKPENLGAAHAHCMRTYIEMVRESATPVVVDNTNCSVAEVAPYLAVAQAYGHEIHVITLLVDPVLAWRRNKHNTPLKSIVQQDIQLRKSLAEWPPWWPQEIFPDATVANLHGHLTGHG